MLDFSENCNDMTSLSEVHSKCHIKRNNFAYVTYLFYLHYMIKVVLAPENN